MSTCITEKSDLVINRIVSDNCFVTEGELEYAATQVPGTTVTGIGIDGGVVKDGYDYEHGASNVPQPGIGAAAGAGAAVTTEIYFVNGFNNSVFEYGSKTSDKILLVIHIFKNLNGLIVRTKKECERHGTHVASTAGGFNYGSDTFGAGCMFCQDFNGYGQCTQGYQRIYDQECNLCECKENGSSLLMSCNIDIIFDIDESDSITFPNDVIEILDSEANIGILTFNGSAPPEYQLNDDETDKNNVKCAINNIVPNGGGTNFDRAIDLAIVMFANGDACAKKTIVDAEEITIIVVGILQAFNSNAPLTTCLVNGVNNDIMYADSFDEEIFDAVSFDLGRRACGGDSRNECESGYFKKDDNYICEDCQVITGEGCMFFQDFNGCGQ